MREQIIVVVLVAIVVQAILIGWLAQAKFEKTGVVWALVALGINIAIVTFLDMARSNNPALMYQDRSSGSYELGMLVMTMGISTALMLIVLYTLPKPKH